MLRVGVVFVLIMSVTNAVHLRSRMEQQTLPVIAYGALISHKVWPDEPCAKQDQSELEKKNPVEAVNCCFNQESVRLKRKAVLEGSTMMTASFLPVGGDFFNGIAQTYNTVSELEENNCHQLAARATLNAISDVKTKITNEVKKVDQKVSAAIQSVERTQQQVLGLEGALDKQMNRLAKSVNSLAEKLDQLSQKVVENGQRLEQATYNQLAIQMKNSIAGIINLFNTLVRLAKGISEYDKHLVSEMQKEQNKEIFKEYLKTWAANRKNLAMNKRQSLLELWVDVQRDFVQLSAVLGEGNFLALHINHVIQEEVDKWIAKKKEHVPNFFEKGCAPLFKKANIDAIVEQIREATVKGDNMLQAIAAAIAYAKSVSGVITVTFALDQAGGSTEFKTTFSQVVSSLQEFTATMSSKPSAKGSFARHLAKVLSVVVPTLCDPKPECRAAAFEAGFSNTEGMVVWKEGVYYASWYPYADVHYPIMATNPTCRLVDKDCEVKLFECAPLYQRKYPPNPSTGKELTASNSDKYVLEDLTKYPGEVGATFDSLKVRPKFKWNNDDGELQIVQRKTVFLECGHKYKMRGVFGDVSQYYLSLSCKAKCNNCWAKERSTISSINWIWDNQMSTKLRKAPGEQVIMSTMSFNSFICILRDSYKHDSSFTSSHEKFKMDTVLHSLLRENDELYKFVVSLRKYADKLQ